VNLCSCRLAARPSSTELLRCDTCGGWISRGQPLSWNRVLTITGEVVSILAELGREYEWLLSLSYDPTRRGEPSRGSGPSDPTGSAAVDAQRARIAACMALCGEFLRRAVTYLRFADEALGEAKFASDPRPPERAEGDWWPQLERQDEIEAARQAQARRHARGEGIP
jgi:hypothetical protein